MRLFLKKFMPTFQLFTTPTAAKSIKKLTHPVKKHIRKSIEGLTKNPLLGESLHGPLRFLYSLHTRYLNVDYREIYEI